MDYSSLEDMAKQFGIDKKDDNGIAYEQFLKISKEVMKKLPKVNIVITGKTGVGKSTLINACFRKKLAETGSGRPVTRESQWLSDDASDFPLRIYDTVGLELSEKRQQSVAEKIKTMIQIRRGAGDRDKLIHCVWYCVAAPSDRFEPMEEDFIRDLAEKENVPVILVLTKAYRKKHAQSFLQKLLEDYPNLPVKAACVVLAQDEEELSAPAYGLDTLVEKTAECLPEELRYSWCNAQTTSLKMKKEQALKIVKQAVAAAGTIGANPVPMSDAVILVPNQIIMLLRITNVFGFPVTKQWILNVVGSLMGTSGTTLVGRMVVANLLKFLPGGGSVTGGVINSITAGILTFALGNAYIRWMEYMYESEKGATEDWLNAENKDILAGFFKEAMKAATPENIDALLKGVQAFSSTTGIR